MRHYCPMKHLIARIFAFCLMALPAAADDSAALRDAFRFAEVGDWAGAQAAVASAGEIARDVVEWRRLRAGEGDLGEYEAFRVRRKDWPGLRHKPTPPRSVRSLYSQGRLKTAWLPHLRNLKRRCPLGRLWCGRRSTQSA